MKIGNCATTQGENASGKSGDLGRIVFCGTYGVNRNSI